MKEGAEGGCRGGKAICPGTELLGIHRHGGDGQREWRRGVSGWDPKGGGGGDKGRVAMVRKRHRRQRMGSGWETGRQRQSKSRRPFLKAQGVGRGGTRGWQKDVSTLRARRHVTAGPRKNEVSVTDRAGAAGIHTGEWKGGEGGGLSSPAPPPVPRPSIRHSTLGVGDSHSSCRADAAAFSERATLRTIGPPVADPLRGTVGLTANASQNADRVPYSPHRIADGGAT